MAVRLEVREAMGVKGFVLGSPYLPYEQPNPPPIDIKRLIEYFQRNTLS